MKDHYFHCLITNTVIRGLELFRVRDSRFKAKDGLTVWPTHAEDTVRWGV